MINSSHSVWTVGTPQTETVHDSSHPKLLSGSTLQILLYKTEEPGADHILGTKKETSVKCLKGIRSLFSLPDEVHLYQCVQHG